MSDSAENPEQTEPSKHGSTIKSLRSQQQTHSASLPPYNPGLHDLVEGKQAWAESLGSQARDERFLGWHQRGYLPHRDAPGLTQFVTLRLHDSLPASQRGEWEALLRIEDTREQRIRLEEYLDRSHGECWLRQPDIAALTEGALRHFDGSRYELLAWVVMPNHVHVLVQIWELPLAKLIHSWKGFIAREANKRLGRKGTFWEREYWDTYMRDEEQCLKARRYTEQNPVKAKLARDSKEWPYSSARFRDEYGRLTVGGGSIKSPTTRDPEDGSDGDHLK